MKLESDVLRQIRVSSEKFVLEYGHVGLKLTVRIRKEKLHRFILLSIILGLLIGAGVFLINLNSAAGSKLTSYASVKFSPAPVIYVSCTADST